MTDAKNKWGPGSGVSRRDFLHRSGAAAVSALPAKGLAAAEDPGPQVVSGKQAITLHVNGQERQVQAEPRTTLLEALRYQLDLTGAKPISDDGTGGACTVLVDGQPKFASTILALQAVGKKITTIEGLGGDQPDAVSRAFVEHDAAQCGFCTPGFVVAIRAFLERAPPCDRGRDTAGAQREYLPLRHLRQHHSGRDRGRQRRLIMADYYWPKRDAARIIGKDTNRVDGLAKATGAAKYTYDIHPQNMLIARALGCPHAHCRIKAVDTAVAAKSPGVVHVHVLEHAKPGSEIEYEGELLVIVTAESEGRRGGRPLKNQNRIRAA